MSILLLKNTLDDIFKNKGLESIPKIKEGLLFIQRTLPIIGILEDIVADEERLIELSENSYFHPNGFDKIVLFLHPDYKLRLHIWWPIGDIRNIKPNDIHNHRWDFGSLVLSGSFLFQLYSPGNSGIHVHEYRYQPVNGGKFSLEFMGDAMMEKAFECQMRAGMLYALRHDAFHRVTPDPLGLTVSLMLQNESVKGETSVFMETPLTTLGGGSEKFIERLDTSQLKERLEKVIDALRGL